MQLSDATQCNLDIDNLRVRNSLEKITYALCSITHRETPNLPGISWFEWPFWCFFCWYFVWFNHEQTPQLSSFIWTEKLSSTSPKIISRLVTHMKYLHTCLAEISPLPFTLQKHCSVGFLKSGVMVNFRIRSENSPKERGWGFLLACIQISR